MQALLFVFSICFGVYLRITPADVIVKKIVRWSKKHSAASRYDDRKESSTGIQVLIDAGEIQYLIT